MSGEAETLKSEIRKLASQAARLKMDLHDLAEDLPVGWQQVVSVAERTEDAYRRLDEARERLKALEGASP